MKRLIENVPEEIVSDFESQLRSRFQAYEIYDQAERIKSEETSGKFYIWRLTGEGDGTYIYCFYLQSTSGNFRLDERILFSALPTELLLESVLGETAGTSPCPHCGESGGQESHENEILVYSHAALDSQIDNERGLTLAERCGHHRWKVAIQT